MIIVASTDCGSANDPKASGLALHNQGPTFINAYCQATTDLVDHD